MKKLFITVLMTLTVFAANAQRVMEKLDRGLVAVKSSEGVFLSWRILGEEYYDVEYNVYRDGSKINATPLSVSNFVDAGGSTSNTYTIKAVVNGVEQPTASKAAKVLSENYLELQPAQRISNDGTTDITNDFEPNDAIIADVDGDGEMEILIKQINLRDQNAKFPKTSIDWDRIEVYKLDGTLLWWIEMGPNMTDFQHNETNIAAYDWDGDGKAECILRAADGTVIHMADGTTQLIGDHSKNYRQPYGSNVEYFVYEGDEFLLYLNGETGKPYQVQEYPLKRLEAGETSLNTAWGDGYGHRSSKHFFGAPYLDGRKPSIFMARGIYTRHKMVAYDVNPATHELVERWRWVNNTPGSPWYGQGYHNYSIADVDWDGRDEIVFGSMVIDDNGKGLSTAGLGHGDAHHVGDFDPYTHGQEVFACNEDNPNNNFRDATTSKIYYRTTGNNDDGRALMGNFLNDYPGAQGISTRDDNLISSVTHKGLTGDNKASVTITQNFRIYWDGDLCDESFDYINGKNTAGGIYKPREGRIAVLEGSRTNNDTKGTPCFQGDIFGDWREEVIMRTDSKSIRIYTTTIPTAYRIYTLLHDPQYRNAMITQMNGYNQPPHPSFFLGELEGITTAPAPQTMTGREEILNGGTIGSAHKDKHLILCETGNATISVDNGAAPYIFTDNAPTWVQGNNNNDNIVTTTYTHTLTGGAFTGNMRLVKQGDGVLSLPNVTQTYTGNTDVWAGTLIFDGTMQGSRVWLNRFAELNSDGGTFSKGIQMDYASILRPGGEDKVGKVTTDSLILNFGSRIMFDCYSDGTSDCVNAAVLKIEKKDWKEGPQYLTPVFEIVPHTADNQPLAPGKYKLMEIGKIEGDIDHIVIEGADGLKAQLSYENGNLYFVVSKLREAADITWTGSENGVWDFYTTKNFLLTGTSDKDGFVTDDNVVFNDEALVTDITISDDVYPGSVVFLNNEKTYTFDGKAIAGESSVKVAGNGTVVLNNRNTYNGGTFIEGGVLRPASLGNADGQEYGALGNATAKISMSHGGTLDITTSMTSTQPISVSGEGAINVKGGASLAQNGTVSQDESNSILHKTGTGSLTLGSTTNIGKLVINGGTVYSSENSSSVMNLPGIVVFDGMGVTLDDVNNIYSYSTNKANFEVTEGSTATINLDGRCTYTGTLTGKGTLNVVARYVRNDLTGNWSAFEGTVNARQSGSSIDFRWFNTYGLPKATLNIASGVTVNCESRNISLGNLTGSGNLLTSGTITIGSLDKNITFTGTFAPNGSTKPSIIKVGSGRWNISKENNSFRSMRINGGMLYLNSTSDNVLIPSLTINVADSGMVGGRGCLQSVMFDKGTTLRPGVEQSVLRYNAFKAKGTITMNSGSHLQLYVINARGGNNDHSWIEASTLTLNGDVTLEAYSGYIPVEGDEIILWQVDNFNGTPSAINLPELPEGLLWDTSDLLKPTGIVRVVSATGIGNIANDKSFKAAVYTLDGTKVGDIITTKATMQNDVKALGVNRGVYCIRTENEILKVIVK